MPSIQTLDFEKELQNLYNSIEMPVTIHELSYETRLSSGRIIHLVSELEKRGKIAKFSPSKFGLNVRKIFRNFMTNCLDNTYVYRTNEPTQVEDLTELLIKSLPPFKYLERAKKNSLISAASYFPADVYKIFKDYITHFPTEREAKKTLRQKRYRSRVEIAAKILEISQAPTGLNNLLTGANVSYSRLTTDYLPELIDHGYLEKLTNRKYKTTESGVEILSACATLGVMMTKIISLQKSGRKEKTAREFSRKIFAYIKNARRLEKKLGMPVIRVKSF